MAGVASPMIRQRPWSGARFLGGLAAGGMVAGLLLGIAVYLAGGLLTRVLPAPGRLWLLAAVAVALGVADLRNRTPQVWRQVPQRYVRVLRPGTLGLVWGFDLGLLVTTQKTVSLLWLSIAAVLLLDPTDAPVVLASVALVASTAVVIWSLLPWATRIERRQDRTWVRRVRLASAGVLLTVGLGVTLGAVLA